MDLLVRLLLSVGIHSHTHLDFRFDIFHGILRINRHRAEKTLVRCDDLHRTTRRVHGVDGFNPDRIVTESFPQESAQL